MKVKDVMTKRPVTVKPNDTLGRVVGILSEKRISGLPVVENDKLIGVISQTDVIRAVNIYDKINEDDNIFEMILGVLGEKDSKIKSSVKKLMKLKVKDFLHKNPIFIDAEEDLYKSTAMLNRYEVDRLPVVSKGKLVGIISKLDIIRAIKKMSS